MKRFIIPLITGVMVAGIIFSGCAAPAPTPVEPTPVEPTPVEPTPVEPTPTPAVTYPPEPAGVYAQPNPMWGVAIKPDGTPYFFGQCSPWTFDEWAQVSQGVIGTLVRRAGGEVTTYDAEAIADAQIGHIEDLIVKHQAGKCAGVITVPIDSAGLAPVCDRAWEAGLPVFNYDHPVLTDTTVSFVTMDFEGNGRIAGEYFGRKAEETGEPFTVYMLWGSIAEYGCIQHYEGLKGACEAHPMLTLMQSGDLAWRPEAAMESLLAVLPTHPEIKAIYDMDGMSPGIFAALEQLDRMYPMGHPEHVYVIDCGTFSTNLGYLREGFSDGIVPTDIWAMSDILTRNMLMYCCCGKPVLEKIVVPAVLQDLEYLEHPTGGVERCWGDQLYAEPDFDKWPIMTWPEEMGIVTPTVEMKLP